MIKIIGAGMAGLLAANLLRRRDPVVYETQRSLPHNHSAVLRFRSDLVGEVLGIPFRRVRVIKSTLPWRNPVADSLAYSFKTTGMIRTDRSIVPGTEVVERWIAPPDFIERMAEGLNIKFETEVDVETETEKVISTIPMPNLMIMMHYVIRPHFGCVRGTNIRVKLGGCEAYVSMYVPDPDQDFYRLSITGNELIIECGVDFPIKPSREKIQTTVHRAMLLLGMYGKDVTAPVEVKHQTYQKILPIDDVARRDFIHWASVEQKKAFSLGRYATWRPGLLLDDLVQDVRKIDGWIDDKYGMDLHRGRR